jgi:hypothetical protein
MKPTRPESEEGDRLERSTLQALARLDRIPYLRTTTLTLTLASGSNAVAHGFGRRPAGWLAHSELGGLATVAAVSTSEFTISASAAMTLTLEVW